MGRPKGPGTIEVGDLVAEMTPAVATDKVSDLVPEEPGAPIEYVPRQEYDEAVRSLRNEISALKELVDDLEKIVTAPTGSVTFSDVVRDNEDIGPNGVQEAIDRRDNTPWYGGSPY